MSGSCLGISKALFFCGVFMSLEVLLSDGSVVVPDTLVFPCDIGSEITGRLIDDNGNSVSRTGILVKIFADWA